MSLVEMIKTNKELKAQFDNVVYLEGLVDSIDYMKNKTSTQEEIDDYDTVNDSFIRALETMGLTGAQYYEVKETLV